MQLKEIEKLKKNDLRQRVDEAFNKGGWPTLPRDRSERLVFPGAASSPSCGGQAAGEGAGLDADRAGGPPALGTEMSRGMVPVPPMSGYGVNQAFQVAEKVQDFAGTQRTPHPHPILLSGGLMRRTMCA